MVLTQVVNLVVYILVFGNYAIVTLPADEMSRVMIGKVMLLKKVAGRNAITHRFVCVKAILLVL